MFYLTKTFSEVRIITKLCNLISTNSSVINHFYFLKLPKHIVFPALTLTCAYWLANVNPDAQVYFTIMFIIIVAGNTAVGFGKFYLSQILV
jgi:hypothetical protein